MGNSNFKTGMDHDWNFYRILVEHLHDGVYFTGTDRRILYWNSAAEQLTGFKAEEVVGRHCADGILLHVSKKGEQLCQGGCPIHRAMAVGKPAEDEVFLRHKAGHRVPIRVRATPVHDEAGKVIGAVEVFFQDTPAEAAQEQIRGLQRQALVDELTNLPNRRFLEGALQSRMNEFARYGWPMGVLFADVDHFKKVNDRYGHDVGDRALQMVGRTLVGSVRPSDVAGRWGGEEFLVVAANTGADELRTMADRLRILVAQSGLDAGGQTLQVTVSVGGTIARPEDTAESLLKRVDHLLYRSKAEGRDRVTFG